MLHIIIAYYTRGMLAVCTGGVRVYPREANGRTHSRKTNTPRADRSVRDRSRSSTILLEGPCHLQPSIPISLESKKIIIIHKGPAKNDLVIFFACGFNPCRVGTSYRDLRKLSL